MEIRFERFCLWALVSILTLIGRLVDGFRALWIAPIHPPVPIGLTLVPVKSWQD